MNSKGYKKIESIITLKRYGLPIPQTIFVFDFKKQEKEIDKFLKGKRTVTIRSDKKGGVSFCPCWIGCHKSKAKANIKKITKQGYAVLLQKYVPVRKDRASGNILILKKHFLVELMGEGPLTWMNREGLLHERAKFLKNSLKEVEHFGKRLISKNDLKRILLLAKRLPSYKILEFTLRPEGLYCWQIVDDKTAKKLKD